jgi:sulfide:quinone oxidoreductase
MSTRVIVLGAGFGGLELTTLLSAEFGEDLDVTLIDKNDSFVFGFSKLDVLFGHASPESVRHYYRDIAKPGVTFLQETVTAIDPGSRTVTTSTGDLQADILVIGLGLDYDLDATPGLAESNEFYSVAGAERVAPLIQEFSSGRALIGVCDAPFKCPPAPSEAALMLHDELTRRGVRDQVEITLVIPFGKPVPPSPETSEALLEAFAERGIKYVGQKRISAVDNERGIATLDDGSELAFDFFLGVPRHKVPDVLASTGLVGERWLSVNPKTLETDFPGVYAIGDCADVGVPKAGVFAEGTARVVAEEIIASVKSTEQPAGYAGLGSCYIEFGDDKVARVDVDFMSGPSPIGTFNAPSEAITEEKKLFGSSRHDKWFGS